MSDLAATAERLRVVKQAYQHFLTLWALDRLMSRPAAADRFHADIEQAASERAAVERAVEDPYNHDWSLLYRGSVLDD
jgi:hypothetical protein